MVAGGAAVAKAVKDLVGAYVEVARGNLSPTPGRVISVYPGRGATIDGDCAGQLWGRVVDVRPQTTATPRYRGIRACDVPSFIVTIELGIARCAAVINDQGEPPSPAQITADGVQALKDMGAFLDTIDQFDCTRELVSWIPTGPEGGYTGGTLEFTARVSNVVGA